MQWIAGSVSFDVLAVRGTTFVRLRGVGRGQTSLIQDPEMCFVEQQAKQRDVFGAETGRLFPCFTVSEQSKS